MGSALESLTLAAHYSHLEVASKHQGVGNLPEVEMTALNSEGKYPVQNQLMVLILVVQPPGNTGKSERVFGGVTYI